MRSFVSRSLFVLSSTFLLSYSLSITLPAGAQSLPHSYAQPRIAKAIDESSLVTLHGNTHPLAQPSFDHGPAPVSMPANRLLLVLARSTQQEADLQTWLQSLQDVNSPNYHAFLSPEEFGKRFGVGDADLQSIQNWLTDQGFTVNKVSKARMAIEFSGSVGQVQSAFHTSLHSYVVNGVQNWANATDPQIPTSLAPVVAGLASLNSFKPRAQYIRGPSATYDTKTHTITPTYTFNNSSGLYYIFLGPADAATIYNTPTLLNANRSGSTYDGTGVTIGVAGDSNIDLTQNANYRTTFGLAANPTTVVVDGTDPGENSDAVEAYLDTQVATGIAPGASVILYTAADTYYNSGLFLAIQRALDDNQADILNVSFGGCESAQGASGNQYILNLWEQAAAQGISVTVSSGDSGSAGCDNENTETVATQGLAVNGLASTPYNISVGGTDFDILDSSSTSFTTYVDISNTLPNHRSALGYIPERPWNDSTYPNSTVAANKPISVAPGNTSTNNIIAGGGGISTVYPVPAWQSGFASGGYRNQPDVSFLAGNGFYFAAWGLCTDFDTNSSGVSIPDCVAPTTGNSFNLTGVGGTSASAPAFAGMLALVKQKTGTRLGQADDVLYNLARTSYSTIFHDVINGNNSVNCQANSSSGCSLNTAGYYFLTGYNATTGYDQASGLGSVNATALTSNWASAGLLATSSSLQLNGGTGALNITHGASVAVNASVTGTSGTPSGDIALVDNLSPAIQPNSEGITFFTLSGGAVSSTTAFLPGGSYNVSAHYGGSSTFAQSDSNAIPVTVAAESSTTNLKISGYYDPTTGKAAATPYYGFIYLIDAQPYGNSASSANPNGAATGTITFKNGSTTLGTAALASDGIAELQTTMLPGGNNSLTAAFPGDPSFLASTSSPYSFTVVPAVTVLRTPSPSSGSIVVGASVTFSVTLSANSFGVAPTGTVTFMNGSTSLGAASLVGTAATSTVAAGGKASFSTTALPAGTDSVTAVYSGDGNYGGSTSLSVSISVTTTAPVPGLTISGTAVSVARGASTSNTSTITVTPSGGFTGSVALTAAITSSPTGAVYLPTFSFASTTPVSITGTTAGTATLTIATTAATSAALAHPNRPGVPWYAAGGATLACLLLFGIPARRRSWRSMLGMLALLVALAGGVFACGGGGSTGGSSGGGIVGTTAGSYVITVTGTSGSTTATGNVTLNVQ